MIRTQTPWPVLLLSVAAAAGAEAAESPAALMNSDDSNIPDELRLQFTEPDSPAADTFDDPPENAPDITARNGDHCDSKDCLAAPEQTNSPVEVQSSTRLVPPPIHVGPPAERAVAESQGWAENPKAMPQRDSGGRVVFMFSESVPTVICAPLRVCDIQLEPGETVQGAPHIGDGVRWKIGPALSGGGERQVTHLIVKPTEPGLDTNLVVPTNRRTYHLRLVSSASHYVSSVAFEYPGTDEQAWRDVAAPIDRHEISVATGQMPTVAVNRLNFNYRIKVVRGKPTFRPLRAMDDGYHTYVAMSDDLPQREAPALIGISPSGAEQMINYRLKGNLYVVDGTVHKLALISGAGKEQERIELTRDECKRRGWLGICWDAKE